jgi:hypothetical protein
VSLLPRIERALLIGAAVFGAIALTALLWPARVPTDELAPAGLSAHANKAAARVTDTSAPDAVIAGNIFSPTRAAPARRFNPAEPEPVSAPPEDNADVVVSEEEAVPRLFGIVIGPAGASALMRLDASNPEAQIYREGDSGGRYRVVKINERSVILEGPSGRIELRLQRPERATP